MAVVERRAAERPDPDLSPPFVQRPTPTIGVARLEAGAALASRFFDNRRAPLAALMVLMLSGTMALAFSNRSVRTLDDDRELPAEGGGPTPIAPSSAGLGPSASGSPDEDGDLPDRDRPPAGPALNGFENNSAGATSSTSSAGSANVSSSTSDSGGPTTSPTTTVPASTSPSAGAPSTTIATSTTTTTAPTTTTKAPTTTTTAPSTTTTVPEPSLPPPVDLVTNGGFEQAGPAPRDYGYFTPDGWTSSAGVIELWASGFNGVSSFSGRQHLELNGSGPETISQQLPVFPGQTYRWTFAHRGRDNQDTTQVLIDGVVVDTVVSDPGSWRVVSGTVTIPAGTTQVLFGLRAVDSGSRANLIDAVSFQRID